MRVKLTYFKDTGKYYTDGEAHVDEDLSMHEVWEWVACQDPKPGLSSAWTDGFILVEVPDHPHNHPYLILPAE